MNNTGMGLSNKPRYPSYRQWKAWRSMRPSRADLCFICCRTLSLFDGLSTTKVIGGKAAAFGGNGTERIGYNRPDDKIKAGCTVKIKELTSEVVTPAHTVQFNGVGWEVPERVERKYKDKLMTVSVSGIGCELCRTLALISARGYVDVSGIVLLADPAPASGPSKLKGSKQKALRGVVTLGNDNILRVKDYIPAEEFVAPVEPSSAAPITKVSKPVDPLAGLNKRLKSTQDSLLYWIAPNRKVGTVQTANYIGEQAAKAARETASIHRQMARMSGKPQFKDGAL